MKEILTCKTSVVIVVCPLKSIVQDQIAEAYSMGLTGVSLANNRLEYNNNIIITLFKSQIILAEHECSTNWGDCKSNKSNQINQIK